jgi:hypothetical protein
MYNKAVEEIRERRKKLLKDNYNGSIDKFIDEAIKWEKQHSEKIVNLHKIQEMLKAS